MRNPYTQTIERVIETLQDLDVQLTEALASMQELHEEVLRLTRENGLLKREGYGQTNHT